MSKKSVIITAVVAGVIGIGIGSVGSTPEPAEKPAAVAPKIVEKTVEVEVEKEVEVTRLPDACTKALDAAESAFTLAGEGFGYAAQAIQAQSEFDLAAAEEASAGLVSTNDRLTPLADKYVAQAAVCRAAE